MKKKYITLSFILLFIGLFCSSNVQAQLLSSAKNQANISIYPNPVEGNKVSIVSKNGMTKKITIYNVLGEMVLFKVLVGIELDISSLKQGVYMLNIKEQDRKHSMKLIRN